MALIDGKDIEKMIIHWLNTPPNSYLGSSYGFDKWELLFKPQQVGVVDDFLAKLKADLPVVRLFSDRINVYSLPLGVDNLLLFLQVGDVTIDLNSILKGKS